MLFFKKKKIYIYIFYAIHYKCVLICGRMIMWFYWCTDGQSCKFFFFSPPLSPWLAHGQSIRYHFHNIGYRTVLAVRKQRVSDDRLHSVFLCKMQAEPEIIKLELLLHSPSLETSVSSWNKPTKHKGIYFSHVHENPYW